MKAFARIEHTLDLFKALPMQLAYCVVLLTEKRDAAIQWIGDLEIVVVEIVLAVGFLVN